MPTILVADDNSNIQKMVTLALKEQGISVVAVGNGEAAIRKVPDLRPDLVLADIFMPVRNGYEVCEFVKQDSRYAHIPVILLVGAFDPLDEHEAQRVGADGVLKKPFVPPEPLINLVKTMLARTASEHMEPAAAAVERRSRGATPRGAQAQIVAPDPPPEPPIQDYAVRPEHVAFGEGEKPLAFGELLQTPAPEPQVEPEPEVVTRRETGFEEMRAWDHHDSEDDAAPDSGTEESDEIKPARPRRDDAALLRPPSFGTEEPGAPIAHEEDEIPQPRPDPLAEMRRTAAEWLEASRRHSSPASEGAGEGQGPPKPAASAPPTREPAPAAHSGVHEQQKPPPVKPMAGITAAPSPSSTSMEEKPEATEPAPIGAGVWEELAQHASELAAATWPNRIAPLADVPATEVAQTAPPARAAEAARAAPPAVVESAAKPGAGESISGEATSSRDASEPPSPELIAAVVAKVLERMQPQLLDAVTREVLKPMAEALVRKELDKR